MHVIVYLKRTQNPTLAHCETNILRYGIKGDEIIAQRVAMRSKNKSVSSVSAANGVELR